MRSIKQEIKKCKKKKKSVLKMETKLGKFPLAWNKYVYNLKKMRKLNDNANEGV